MSADLHSRAKNVFLKARQLKRAARQPYLDDACAGEDALRDEVESLLAFDETKTIFNLETSATIPQGVDAGQLGRKYRGKMAGGLARTFKSWGWKEPFALGIMVSALLFAALDVWSNGSLRSLTDGSNEGLQNSAAAAWEYRVGRVSIVSLTLLLLGMGTILYSAVAAIRFSKQPDAPEQLGQYTLEREIGRGGMGTVYLARHAMMKRPTAVKLLQPSQVNDMTLASFQREVHLASRLKHPNTIAIYDYGKSSDGIFYYAMEYVDGLTLHQLVAQYGAITPARVVHLVRQICFSLREAHDLGLIHRDIKCQNIMLCQRGSESDIVKVLDFGLVKSLEQGDADGSVITFGSLAGTPTYMAPERLRDPRILNERIDIYSLGVLMYNLLTGEDDPGARDELSRHAQDPSPSRPPIKTREPVPPALEELVYDCKATDPLQRPKNVREILARLGPLHRAHPWSQAEAERWWDVYLTACESLTIG